VDEVLRGALNEDQRCEALYYGGERSITAGDLKKALACFEQCLSINVHTFERWCAEVELQKLEVLRPYLSIHSEVRSLATQLATLSGEGRTTETVEVARQAWELADRKLPPSDPYYRVALQNICTAYFIAHDYRLGIPLTERLLTILMKLGDAGARSLQ